MSFDETYSKIHAGKHIIHFLFRITWNKEML
jgi:hypothetical protein